MPADVVHAAVKTTTTINDVAPRHRIIGPHYETTLAKPFKRCELRDAGTLADMASLLTESRDARRTTPARSRWPIRVNA
jgi:hypothetical protein